MDWIERSGKIDIQPFWNKIPSFFLYGLRPIPVIISTVSGLILFLLPNFWTSFLLYAIAVKYSMEALQHTMRGTLSPPPLSYDVLFDRYELPLMLFAVLTLYMLALSSISNSLGLTTALILFLVGAFLLPALIMCLGMSESFMFSANPLQWLILVKRIGWAYLALYGLQISLTGAKPAWNILPLYTLIQADWLRYGWESTLPSRLSVFMSWVMSFCSITKHWTSLPQYNSWTLTMRLRVHLSFEWVFYREK